jgi:exodeoxyribonuclease-3
MRLATWNCCMAFDKKIDDLLVLRPDIAIVPESADSQTLRSKRPDIRLSGHVWEGKNKHKGLGVMAFGAYELELDTASYSPSNEIVLPIRVNGPVSFNLLAVWSFNDRGQPGRRKRPGPVLRAIDAAARFCAESRPLVIAGDFNNHTVWDKPGKPNNMAAIYEAIEGLGLVSAYHWNRGVALGDEREPTHFWRDRRKDGPTYHIDYVFVPRQWASGGMAFEIGGFEGWCGPGGSDHVPLLVDVP